MRILLPSELLIKGAAVLEFEKPVKKRKRRRNEGGSASPPRKNRDRQKAEAGVGTWRTDTALHY